MNTNFYPGAHSGLPPIRTPMRPHELMTTARCRKWLELCTGFAQESLQLAGQAPETTFVPREDEFFSDSKKVGSLGLLLQWACEDNEAFAAAFRAIAHSEQALCPFHHEGLGFIVNVVRNGIMDDWEIYAHWGEGGYVVVPEHLRLPSDRRFDYAWAPDWLHRRCGGVRTPDDLPRETIDALHVRAIELFCADWRQHPADDRAEVLHA
jgi:hypothetical protein